MCPKNVLVELDTPKHFSIKFFEYQDVIIRTMLK